MTADTIVQIFGWIASAGLVVSVLQTKFLRFRIINGTASALLAVFNALLGVWPQVAMNAVLVVINIVFIVKMNKNQKESKAFTFAIEPVTGELVGWFLARHGTDLAAFHPDLADRLSTDGIQAAVLFHDDEAMGLTAFRSDGQGGTELLADYVVPRFRDYAPGEFVFSPTGPLCQAGATSVWIDNPTPAVAAYLTTMGFAAPADGAHRWQRALAQA
jgi:uncharacterized membrane protein